MTYTVSTRLNYPDRERQESIATSGISDWKVLEDLEQKSASNLSKYSASIEAYQKRYSSNQHVYNRFLKKTKKIITEHNNFKTSYFFQDSLPGTISPSDSKSSSFIDSKLNSEDVEYVLQIIRSPEISRLHEVDSIFYLQNRIEVINYLLENSSLIPILLNAYNQIKKVFTSNEKLSLELCLDPEVSNWEKLLLSIYVGCDADVDKVYSLKEHLDDNWWIDVYSSVPNLDINVSFDEF